MEIDDAVNAEEYVPATHAVLTPPVHQYPPPQFNSHAELPPCSLVHFPLGQFKQDV